MREMNVCLIPMQRFGLAYPVIRPADATRFFRAMARPLVVAVLLLVLGWGLVWASQQAAGVVTGAVTPAMTASFESRSLVSEQDLQSQVDAYLANLTADTPDR